MTKTLYKDYTREEVEARGGCVFTYIDKANPERDLTVFGAWDRLARVLVSKYINKAPWIKKTSHKTNYDGTYTLKVYADNGTYIYQYMG